MAAVTIPSRLARIAETSGARVLLDPLAHASADIAPLSGSWSVAHARSRALYRDWFRAAPEICTLYCLNVSPAVVRAKIRQDFERTRWVDDLEAMDILLHKGHVEFQETLNCWKMESHVMRYATV
jgi:NADH dehydrogenase (ubiquinone) 1 alpha subcomplex subunit 6